ncbi:DUF3562 domain-containing protein [Cupriavidus necator]|uniref:DUF3562 domain-containing protein n=1 Tax=Cupriavidus necator TaxID=106590 RepID=UPI001E32EF76|nr:DUF3562 domain-containing protein [Cupriavidus necator]
MLRVTEASRNMPPPALEHAPVKMGRTRPRAGEDAIARIAVAHGAPLEFVRWQFWNAWDALQEDAKFPDYLLVLTERKVVEALRRRRRQADI